MRRFAGRTLLCGLGLALLTPSAVPAVRLRAHLRRPRAGLQVRLRPVAVPARHEREVCEAIRLDNREPIDIDAMQFASPANGAYVSHHFALFVDDNDDFATLPHGIVDSPGCVGFGQNFGAILSGVQAPRAAINYPPGIGFTLQPHQVLLLNLHYINYSKRRLTVDGAVNLRRAQPGSIVHHVRAFQVGTFKIAVPPGQDGQAEGTWIAPFPMNVVLLSTHSHRHTQTVDVDVVRAGVAGEELLETRDWQHPPIERYGVPLRLEAGDGFHWTCRYHNDTPQTLRFGITSEDEMCFTIGSFYLDDDAATLPPVPGCYGGDVALTCPDV